MRVSQSMLSNNMLKQMNRSYSNLDKYMNQLATGKKISRPSDDPVVAVKGMGYRTQLSNIKQYERNISELHTWMDASDEALNETTQALHRVRDLGVQASNGTYEEGQRENIAKEVDQLIEHLADIANTKVNNKYIFNGTDTTDKPVNHDGPNVTAVGTNNEPILIEVSEGTTIQANVNAGQIFNEDFFADLQTFSAALKNPDVSDDELSGFIENIDQLTDNVINERADLGARMNRVELVENRLATQAISAERMMSDNEDVEFEEVVMNLTMQEAIHRSTLSAGARVLQPTLIDFLR